MRLEKVKLKDVANWGWWNAISKAKGILFW